MLHTEKEKTYYEAELIKSVECNICHKKYTDVQAVCRINFQIAYFHPNGKFLDTEYCDSKTIHVCQDCLNKFKGLDKTVDRFIDDNYDLLEEE